MVGSLSGIFGVLSAWFCSRYSFLGSEFFSKALILPLAFPSYILAFIYLGFFSHAGFFFSFLRSLNIDIFFPIKTLWGLSLVMSFSLFPYVYFICFRAFKSFGVRALEVSQSLGFSERKSFFKLVLPSHKPWIMTGLLFVTLDVLSDFGASSLFNYNSLSVVIYHAWYNFFSWDMSAQISVFLVLISVIFILAYERSIKKAQFTTSLKQLESSKKRLSGLSEFFVVLFLSLLVFLSFFFPLLQLLLWSFQSSFHTTYISSFFQSLFLGLVGALIVMFLALVFSFFKRWFVKRGEFLEGFSRVAFLGYGVPGTVWAVNVLKLSSFLSFSSLSSLFFGFFLKFFMVGVKPLEAGFERLKISLDEGAMTLGLKPFFVFYKLQFPFLKSTFMLSFILVFVEIIKEMPMTLMMRPSGWSPLSSRIFEFTSEGEWEKAALPSLFIVFLAFLVVLKVRKV